MDERIVARWQDWSGKGIEHTVLRCTQASSTAEGVLISASSGEPFAVRYQIRCDGSWVLNYASIEIIGEQRKVELLSDGRGKWILSAVIDSSTWRALPSTRNRAKMRRITSCRR